MSLPQSDLDVSLVADAIGTIPEPRGQPVSVGSQFINANGRLNRSDIVQDLQNKRNLSSKNVPLRNHYDYLLKVTPRMLSLMHPPDLATVSAYLTGSHSTEIVPKGDLLATVHFGVCDILHRAVLRAFDTHKDVAAGFKDPAISRRKAHAAAVDMVSFEIYGSRTYSRALRYVYASNTAKQQMKEEESSGKSSSLVPPNNMVIDHLRAARTLLRRLSPWAPTVQVLLLQVTASLGAECYSVQLDLFTKIDIDAFALYNRLVKTPAVLRDDATARAFHNTANILERAGKIYEALQRRLAALKCFEVFYWPITDHVNIAAMLSNSGLMYDQCGDKIRGISLKERGHAMLVRCAKQSMIDKTQEPVSERIATSLNNLGVSYQEVGHFELGIKYQEDALIMRKKVYSNLPHEKIAQSLNNLGSALETTARRDQGIAMLNEAVEMNHFLCKAKGQQPPFKSRALAMNHANLGSCLMHVEGCLEQSKKHLEQALDMFQHHGEGQVEHENIAIAENNLGIVIEKLGDGASGLEHKIRALAIRQEIYKDYPAEPLATSLCCVGEGYLLVAEREGVIDQGRRTLGLQHVMNAIKMCKRMRSENLELLLAVSTLLPQLDINDAAYLAIECLPLLHFVVKSAPSYHRIQLSRTFQHALRGSPRFTQFLPARTGNASAQSATNHGFAVVELNCKPVAPSAAGTKAATKDQSHQNLHGSPCYEQLEAEHKRQQEAAAVALAAEKFQNENLRRELREEQLAKNRALHQLADVEPQLGRRTLGLESVMKAIKMFKCIRPEYLKLLLAVSTLRPHDIKDAVFEYLPLLHAQQEAAAVALAAEKFQNENLQRELNVALARCKELQEELKCAQIARSIVEEQLLLENSLLSMQLEMRSPLVVQPGRGLNRQVDKLRDGEIQDVE